MLPSGIKIMETTEVANEGNGFKMDTFKTLLQNLPTFISFSSYILYVKIVMVIYL